MHFRSQKKILTEVLLSDPIESEKDGGELSLMDTLSCSDDIAESLYEKDACMQLHHCILTELDTRERQIICLRYGIPDGRQALTQREVATHCGISRSYVSRRH